MAIPTWLTVTAANVRTDSRMDKAMAQSSYTTDGEFEAEIARHITDWSSIVMSRLQRAAAGAGLTPSFGSDLTSILNTEQQKTACMALKLLVISALWQNLAGTDSNYFNQANDTGLSGGASDSVEKRLTSGEGLLAELERQIKTMGSIAGDGDLSKVGAGMSVQLTRVDGYSERAGSMSIAGRRR